MPGVAVVMTYAGDFKDDYNKIFCLHFSDIRDVVVDTKSVCARHFLSVWRCVVLLGAQLAAYI